MTLAEIDAIFPPSYSGNAQISDLRLLLKSLTQNGQLGGIDLYETNTIAERDNIQTMHNGDICKVINSGNGLPATYIYDLNEITQVGQWKILVESTGGGGGVPGTTSNKITEKFIIDTIDEQDQIVELQHLPYTQEHLFIHLNGMYQTLGSNFDCVLSGAAIIFTGTTIHAGDTLTISYSYI